MRRRAAGCGVARRGRGSPLLLFSFCSRLSFSPLLLSLIILFIIYYCYFLVVFFYSSPQLRNVEFPCSSVSYTSVVLVFPSFPFSLHSFQHIFPLFPCLLSVSQFLSSLLSLSAFFPLSSGPIFLAIFPLPCPSISIIFFPSCQPRIFSRPLLLLLFILLSHWSVSSSLFSCSRTTKDNE